MWQDGLAEWPMCGLCPLARLFGPVARFIGRNALHQTDEPERVMGVFGDCNCNSA